MLEHQQAKQQAQFSEKFHQLKQWQEEQKEKLVQAQQEKMQLLRVQQEQLQRVLAEQRNKQWGGKIALCCSRRKRQIFDKLLGVLEIELLKMFGAAVGVLKSTFLKIIRRFDVYTLQLLCYINCPPGWGTYISI